MTEADHALIREALARHQPSARVREVVCTGLAELYAMHPDLSLADLAGLALFALEADTTLRALTSAPTEKEN